MTRKRKICMGIDLAMVILLPCLMAYSLIGETVHEWMGIGMLLLFLIHHGMNAYWHKNLLRGRYNGVRFMETAVDLLLLAGMVLQGISGFLMSRHVFAFIEGRSGMAFARTAHMLCAYWLFVLMSVHLGFHGNRILGMAGKLVRRKEGSRVRTILFRIATVFICGYGGYAFYNRQLGSYLFMRMQFVFFDYTEPVMRFLMDYLLIMFLFAAAGYYLKKGTVKLQKKIMR